MIAQCATFSKSLNLKISTKAFRISGSVYGSYDKYYGQSKRYNWHLANVSITTVINTVCIRFPFESSFGISVSGCKLTILPDIQPVNWIVIISAKQPTIKQRWAESHFSDSDSAPALHFKTPDPTPKNFETSTPTPVNTPKNSKLW